MFKSSLYDDGLVWAAAAKEKELSRLAILDEQGRAVQPGVLDPLMAILVQVGCLQILKELHFLVLVAVSFDASTKGRSDTHSIGVNNSICTIWFSFLCFLFAHEEQ